MIDDLFLSRTLGMLRIDGRGLGVLDRKYLGILRDRGPLGIKRLAAMLGVNAETLERDHEPYLFHLGLATTSPHGRITLPEPEAEAEAYTHSAA